MRLPVVITSVGEDAHRVDALLDLGSAERLAEGAAQLAAEKPDAVMWACTSGSFVFGPQGAQDQVSAVAAVAGSRRRRRRSRSSTRCGTSASAGSRSRRPTPTTSRSISCRFLTAGGAEVVSMGSHGIYTAAEVGTLIRTQVVAMVAAADHPDAEAVLVPDTAMHTLAIVDKLEAAVGKPVLTANQVTVWKGLELLGPVPPLPGLGRALRGARGDAASSGRSCSESTPSIIADKLRQAIAHGELKPGTQLGEADLARKLGVSRGPLREGMQRLTQEGLLVSIRNRGLFVIDMTPDDVRDMYIAREAIERAAARKILDGDHARGRRAAAASSTRWPRPTTPAAVSELDIAFHERLVRLRRSPRLSRMHQTFITETRMCIHALEETYARPRCATRSTAPWPTRSATATANSPTGC